MKHGFKLAMMGASALALSACSPTLRGAPADHVNNDNLATEMGKCNIGNGNFSIQNRYGAFIASGTVSEQRGDVAVIYDLNMRGYDPALSDEDNNWRNTSPLAERNLVPSNNEAAFDIKTGNCVLAFNEAETRTIVRVTMNGQGFQTHPEVEELSGYQSFRVMNGQAPK